MNKTKENNQDFTEPLLEINNFITWRSILKSEILGGELLYDVPGYYKRLSEKDLFDYYIEKVKNEYIKCFDNYGVELSAGDTVNVQKAGEHKIYKKDGQLYFKPYGKEDRVSSYFSHDITKVIKVEIMEQEITEHYFVRQKMEVQNIIRQQGDGKELIINGVGVIKSVSSFIEEDIAYEVEFKIKVEHSSPYGTKWTTKKNSFYVFHKRDKNNIIKVFN